MEILKTHKMGYTLQLLEYLILGRQYNNRAKEPDTELESKIEIKELLKGVKVDALHEYFGIVYLHPTIWQIIFDWANDIDLKFQIESLTITWNDNRSTTTRYGNQIWNEKTNKFRSE